MKTITVSYPFYRLRHGAEGDERAPSIRSRLLYRNQFILGPSFVDGLPAWRRVSIRPGICLTVHPDLGVCRIIEGNRSITLLGFMLDPEYPSRSDDRILRGFMRKLTRSETFMEHTGRYGGRWALIVDDGSEVLFFHDAAGLRQACYTDPRSTGDLWCASQPGLIAEILRLKADEEALGFINAHKQVQKEYWFPGDATLYKEIRHLIPNHCLNLKTGEPRRYWPKGGLKERPLEEAIDEAASLLKGLMGAAANRFELAVSLTAGWDSRLVLASSRELAHRVSVMTVKKKGMSEDHADVAIPSLLCSRLGLKYDVVPAKGVWEDEFPDLYRQNVVLAHDVWAPDAQAILNRYGLKKAVATGSMSEVIRHSRRLSSFGKDLIKGYLAVKKMGNHPFAVRAFERWFSGLGDLYNFNARDLIYWEQRAGKWLAMCQLEFDTAWKEIFTPYNCRDLLVTMLSVDRKYRSLPDFILYRKLILKLWPEALDVPVNPHKKKTLYKKVKPRIVRVLPVKLHSPLKKALRLLNLR